MSEQITLSLNAGQWWLLVQLLFDEHRAQSEHAKLADEFDVAEYEERAAEALTLVRTINEALQIRRAAAPNLGE